MMKLDHLKEALEKHSTDLLKTADSFQDHNADVLERRKRIHRKFADKLPPTLLQASKQGIDRLSVNLRAHILDEDIAEALTKIAELKGVVRNTVELLAIDLPQARNLVSNLSPRTIASMRKRIRDNVIEEVADLSGVSDDPFADEMDQRAQIEQQLLQHLRILIANRRSTTK